MNVTGERILNIASAFITVITFVGSIIPPLNKNQIKLPYFLNEPLSLSRLLISGILILSCSYAVGYIWSYVVKTESTKAIKYLFYGIFSLISAWLNIFTLKYILYGDTFALTGYYVLGYVILLVICVISLLGFIRVHLSGNNITLTDELSLDFNIFILIIYSIFGFVSIATN